MKQARTLDATSPGRRFRRPGANNLVHKDLKRGLLIFAVAAILTINAGYAQLALVSLETVSQPALSARRHLSHIALWQAYARSINATVDEELFAQIHNDLQPFSISGGIKHSLVIEKVCSLRDVACFTINRQGVNHTFSQHAGKSSQSQASWFCDGRLWPWPMAGCERVQDRAGRKMLRLVLLFSAPGANQIRHAAFYQQMLTSIYPYLPAINIVFGVNLLDEARSWTSPVPPAVTAGLTNGSIDLTEAWSKYACDGGWHGGLCGPVGQPAITASPSN